MTWREFKAAAEAAGVKDDDEIDYIDWGYGRQTVDVSRQAGNVQIT